MTFIVPLEFSTGGITLEWRPAILFHLPQLTASKASQQ